jgi:hypothetical protein
MKLDQANYGAQILAASPILNIVTGGVLRNRELGEIIAGIVGGEGEIFKRNRDTG